MTKIDGVDRSTEVRCPMIIESGGQRGFSVRSYRQINPARLHSWDVLADHLEVVDIRYVLALLDGREMPIHGRTYSTIEQLLGTGMESEIFDYVYRLFENINAGE